MTSICKFDLQNALKGVNSRQEIFAIAKQALALLKQHEMLEINLRPINLTPSIADGIFGLLAEKLGKQAFKEKIAIKNASKAQSVLLAHVIARRIAK